MTAQLARGSYSLGELVVFSGAEGYATQEDTHRSQLSSLEVHIGKLASLGLLLEGEGDYGWKVWLLNPSFTANTPVAVD